MLSQLRQFVSMEFQVSGIQPGIGNGKNSKRRRGVGRSAMLTTGLEQRRHGTARVQSTHRGLESFLACGLENDF